VRHPVYCCLTPLVANNQQKVNANLRGENNLSSLVAKEASSVLFAIKNSKTTAWEKTMDIADGMPVSIRLRYNN